MSNAPITELDFLQIKENLKTYLKGQDRFKDYNFEGSNMNVLLDVLAYNTFQNGFYTNMALNEMFLDTAQLRGSAISHAKVLNYTPRSRVSSVAKIRIRLTVSNNPNFVTVPAFTRFTAQCGNRSFSFYNNESITIIPQNGVYIADNVDVYEGRYVTEFFNVSSSTPSRVLISNANVDISSIRVYIRETAGSATETEFVRSTTVFGSDPMSKVFYIQAADEDKYEVLFGADEFGMAPKTGNVIRVLYRVSSGDEANGINSITAAENISGYPTQVTLLATSAGGAEKETVDSIKFFAPRAFQIQDRAITESDYEILLKSNFPEIQAVSVYGGEELNPPRYGRVVVAIDTLNSTGISENNKAKYATFLRERSPIGIEPIIISPQFMYLNIATTVYFNTKTTDISEASIRQKVLDAILAFGSNTLNDFRTTFRPSNLATAIDNADPNILSNDLNVRPIIPLNPQLNIATRYDVTFNNPLLSDNKLETGEIVSTYDPSVKSSNFTFNGSSAFIIDDGSGNLQIVKTSGTTFAYLSRNIGTVDYDTGRVIIGGLTVSEYLGSELKLIGRTRLATIVPPKDRILTIRPEDVTISILGVRE
jgi:hypothetical protein